MKGSVTGITTESDDAPDFEINIEVSGDDEDAAEKALMHLQDQATRVAQAYDNEKPPEECDGYFLRVDWEGVFNGEYDD